MLTPNITLDGRTVLVTGAAGFIGANLALRLLRDFPDCRVVGIDSITDYYYTSLKHERLRELERFGDRFVFVRVLQEELIRAGILPEDYDFDAHTELVPMQPGDVPVTYADTAPLERDFGFRPSTPIRTGLRRFAEWYAKR